jgi:hypothetical protein
MWFSSPFGTVKVPVLGVKDGFLHIGCTNTPSVASKDWCKTCNDKYYQKQSEAEHSGDDRDPIICEL